MKVKEGWALIITSKYGEKTSYRISEKSAEHVLDFLNKAQTLPTLLYLRTHDSLRLNISICTTEIIALEVRRVRWKVQENSDLPPPSADKNNPLNIEEIYDDPLS